MGIEQPYRLSVLAVDDEPAILRAITSILTTAGFGVVGARHGVAGLEAFAKMPEAFNLVLADVVMPRLGGIAMADEIRHIRPDIPIILMTAFSGVTISKMANLKYPVIRKPFLPGDLMRIVFENIKTPHIGQ